MCAVSLDVWGKPSGRLPSVIPLSKVSTVDSLLSIWTYRAQLFSGTLKWCSSCCWCCRWWSVWLRWCWWDWWLISGWWYNLRQSPDGFSCRGSPLELCRGWNFLFWCGCLYFSFDKTGGWETLEIPFWEWDKWNCFSPERAWFSLISYFCSCSCLYSDQCWRWRCWKSSNSFSEVTRCLRSCFWSGWSWLHCSV